MIEIAPILASQPSVIAGYTGAIARALEQRGVQAQAAFQSAGLVESAGNDPLERLSADQVTALFKACVDLTCDPYFGLSVARYIHASNIHALGYALMASRTLWDFITRLERYFAIVSQSAVLRAERFEDQIRVRFTRRTKLCGETEDAFIAFMLRFMRLLYGRPLVPSRIDLLRECPAPGAEPYIREFGVAPRFNADEGLIIFAADVMDETLPGASPDLAQFNDRIAAECLSRLNRADVIARVRTCVVDRLSSETCTRQRVARDLGMSEAGLQQKLAERGTGFQELLDETRCELAIGYLHQPALTITEIAFLLGFSDASNFTRAFKRWKGAPPSAFRMTR
ncbi:MAG: AraC family transcriptional regulator [Chakrabartia sp.]